MSLNVDDARNIAYNYHMGRSSGLFQFAESGEPNKKAIREAEENLKFHREHKMLWAVPELTQLRDFLKTAQA